MAKRIFIHYRRGDTIATAGRLCDRLAREFGRNNVFMDIDKRVIQPKTNSRSHVATATIA
jgi:hypothetical protein